MSQTLEQLQSEVRNLEDELDQAKEEVEKISDLCIECADAQGHLAFVANKTPAGALIYQEACVAVGDRIKQKWANYE